MNTKLTLKVRLYRSRWHHNDCDATGSRGTLSRNLLMQYSDVSKSKIDFKFFKLH